MSDRESSNHEIEGLPLENGGVKDNFDTLLISLLFYVLGSRDERVRIIVVLGRIIRRLKW